ncbi:MAG TPA: extracellular solute-binding protein [Methylomirabilota bacterium]|jgi:sn-glycerol 3-phosphate transport system substrate-binding protein
MSHRRGTYSGIVAAITVLLAAVTPASAQSPVKITLWHAMGGARYDAITKDIAAGFNRANPSYTLEPLFTGSYAETVTKAIAAIRAGNPPHIVQVFEVGTQTMLDSGAIIPVTEMVKPGEIDFDDYIAPILNYYKVGGKLYSMPFNSSTAIIYYNKEAFQKAGLDPAKPPATFKDVEEMGRKIVASGAARAAITFGWPSWMLEQSHALANRPYADHDNGRNGRATKVLFNEPFGVDVLSRWKRWADEKLLAYGGREYAPNKAFLAGEVAMLMQSTSQVTTIEKAAKFPVGTGFLPRIEGQPAGKSVIGGASFWVLKGKGRTAQEVDAIVRFFKFVAEPEETAKWHEETGYFPATRTAVTLLTKQGWFAKHPNHETAFKQIQEGPDTPATRGVLLGNFVQIRNITDTAIEKALSGKLSPKAALDEAAAEANKLLDEYNRINK